MQVDELANMYTTVVRKQVVIAISLELKSRYQQDTGHRVYYSVSGIGDISASRCSDTTTREHEMWNDSE